MPSTLTPEMLILQETFPALAQCSLETIDYFYRQGSIGPEAVAVYLRAWNSGPHFTQAVLCDGSIRQFETEKTRVYRHLYAKYGVKE